MPSTEGILSNFIIAFIESSDQRHGTFCKYHLAGKIHSSYHPDKSIGTLVFTLDPAIPAAFNRCGTVYQLSPAVVYPEIIKPGYTYSNRLESIVQSIAIGCKCGGYKDLRVGA